MFAKPARIAARKGSVERRGSNHPAASLGSELPSALESDGTELRKRKVAMLEREADFHIAAGKRFIRRATKAHCNLDVGSRVNVRRGEGDATEFHENEIAAHPKRCRLAAQASSCTSLPYLVTA